MNKYEQIIKDFTGFEEFIRVINSIADLVKDPHFQARDMFLTVKDDFFGDFKVPGFAPKLTETESSVAWLGPPDVGAHNREIYGDLLGMSQDDLEALAADGII